jgi:hypothetical protein
LRFEKDTNNLVSFDFTVTPVKGKTLYLTAQPTVNDVGGFSDKSVSTITSDKDSSKTVIKLDSTAGIVPGMIATAADDPNSILAGKGITVSSVVNGNDLILSSPVSIKDDTYLTFISSSNNIDVLDIQAEITDGNVRVKGLLKIHEINEVYIDGTLQSSGTAFIYLDNFITAN